MQLPPLLKTAIKNNKIVDIIIICGEIKKINNELVSSQTILIKHQRLMWMCLEYALATSAPIDVVLLFIRNISDQTKLGTVLSEVIANYSHSAEARQRKLSEKTLIIDPIDAFEANITGDYDDLFKRDLSKSEFDNAKQAIKFFVPPELRCLIKCYEASFLDVTIVASVEEKPALIHEYLIHTNLSFTDIVETFARSSARYYVQQVAETILEQPVLTKEIRNRMTALSGLLDALSKLFPFGPFARLGSCFVPSDYAYNRLRDSVMASPTLVVTYIAVINRNKIPRPGIDREWESFMEIMERLRVEFPSLDQLIKWLCPFGKMNMAVTSRSSALFQEPNKDGSTVIPDRATLGR